MQLHWLFLALAIVSEVFASSMLKLSDGFSKTLPTVGVAVGFIISFYFWG
ncbi:DMT family transporter [Rodentibacter trehalosifermentans]|nr:SMR family transporter [Rodentibacter trehalosifermentans]